MPTPPYDDPFAFFDAWFSEALQTITPDPDAMTLATVSHGEPSIRVVLLKEWDERGFVFYTNRDSFKGKQLAANPVAALHFFWRETGRQIRIRGNVELVDDTQSDTYFASRKRLSQIGAWASLQSQPLPSRATIAKRVAEYGAKFLGRDVPRPPHWGGYRVVPNRMEFWIAAEYRLHDRWEFSRNAPADPWAVQRLFP